MYSGMLVRLLPSTHRPRIGQCSAIRQKTTVTERIEKTCNLVRFIDYVSPYSAAQFNPAKAVWECIEDIPPSERFRILDKLKAKDIRRLWGISEKRYRKRLKALPYQTYSPLADLPEEPNEVIQYEGRMSGFYTRKLRWDRFTKILFVEPESYTIHGRMILNHVPLSNFIYPMYFEVRPRQTRIPATGEVSEIEMELLDRDACTHLTKETLPDKRWPLPKDPRFPFNGNITEYLRPIGPGCYVGMGWREPRLEFNDLGARQHTFVIVKKVDS